MTLSYQMTAWSGIPLIIGSIGVGLLLLAISATYISLYQRNKAEYMWVGLMAALQVLVSFTSSKECGIVLGGREYFIIAGSLIYPVIPCGEDYINEYFGKQIANNSVNAQLISRIFTTLYLVYLINIPAPKDSANNYQLFFELMSILPRIAVASIVATFISGKINVILYAFIKECTKGRLLWLRSMLLTLTSTFINAVLFTAFAFFGIKQINTMLQMVFLSVIVRILSGLLEIPFLYLMRLLHSSLMTRRQKEM